MNDPKAGWQADLAGPGISGYEQGERGRTGSTTAG
jgi:hypothetical protein